MKRIGRRNFLKESVAAAGAGLGLGAAAPALLARPDINDTVRMAVVGIRGRGRSHISNFAGRPKVEIVALCDVDENILAQRADDLEKKTGRRPRRFIDMREVFEQKDIDAVSFATPNHWHSLGSIWACQAGKDVYVEKPCSHNVWEGRKLVEAARKYNRIVQHGSNGRSRLDFQEAIQKLRQGVIGDLYMAKGLCYKWRDTIGRAPDEPAPAGVHYDLWLGPAPQRPFSQNRFHYKWHWHWDYGNGDIGNQGVHQMDIARWGLGVGLPARVQSVGGHLMFDDDQETPNIQISTFEYPADKPEDKKLLVFEVRHWISNHEAGIGSGEDNEVAVLFFGSEGYMSLGYGGYRTYLGKKREPGPSGSPVDGSSHFANFIAALRSRKMEDLNAEIQEGHLSSSLCHLANISYRTGRTLTFNPQSEKFINDPEADALLRREYRSPFVVPESV
ncbi:MAG: Gfo/Idh/MocA family protein [Acidobacteriota bacterium]